VNRPCYFGYAFTHRPQNRYQKVRPICLDKTAWSFYDILHNTESFSSKLVKGHYPILDSLIGIDKWVRQKPSYSDKAHLIKIEKGLGA
jgi:hypothetical protein